jgi:hypothetical protein
MHILAPVFQPGNNDSEVKVKKTVLAVLAILSIAVLALPVLAHHGTGISYDMNKESSVKGVITKFAWANPHSQLYFDVKDAKGNVEHWAAEMRAPGNLIASGYTRKALMDKLAPGKEITVWGNPSKVGAPVMVFIKATLADGYCVCEDAGGGRGTNDTRPGRTNAGPEQQ